MTATTGTRSNRAVAVLLAIFGNAVLIVLSLAWLQIPDGRVWQVGFSFLLALFIALAFLWLQTYTLRSCAEERSARLAVGMLVVAVLLAIAYLLLRPVSALEDRAVDISYIWNSKLPSALRYSLTQRRIYHLLTIVVAALRYWIVPGLLLPFAIAAAAYRSHRTGLRAAGCALLRGRYWLLLGVDLVIAYTVTRHITAWHPGHTPRAQVISLIARTIFAYLVWVSAWLIAVRVACVRVGRQCRAAADAPGNDEAAGEHARGNT